MVKLVKIGKPDRLEWAMLKQTWPTIDTKGSNGKTDKCAEMVKLVKMVKLINR